LWRAIEELAWRVEHGEPEFVAFIRTSCTYGRICFEVFGAAWTLLLLGHVGDESGVYEHERMGKALRAYDAAWEAWRALAEHAPSCATLYRDTYCRYVRDKGMFPHTGIKDTVERYRHLLNRSAAVPTETATN
jgi:hypothetical protein